MKGKRTVGGGRGGKGRQAGGSRVECLYDQVLRNKHGSVQWRQGQRFEKLFANV